MSELPYFAIHLRKPMDSISKAITLDESQSAEDTLRAFGIEKNVNSLLPDGSRSILGTMEIDRDAVKKALEDQLPCVEVTIQNQENFAHEEREDGNGEEGRMES